MALIEKLTNIADAIRSKTGKGDPMTLEQMAEEIDGIEVGGDDEKYIAFLNDELANFDVTEEATTVKEHLFYNSKGIKTADLRNATFIGGEAFRNSSLEEVNLDNLYIRGNIGARTFQNTKLTNVSSNVTILLMSSAPGLFADCALLKNAHLPNVTIANTGSIFQNCSSLEKVVFKATGLTTSNFLNCSNLTTVVLLDVGKIAVLGNVNNFTGTPIASGTGYIYVPKALIEEYKVATNWITFSEQFRAIEDYPEICGGATE